MEIRSHLRRSSLLICGIFTLCGCVRTKDLTPLSPYNSLAGIEYVLVEDCYIFSFRDNPHHLLLGSARYDSTLRRALDKSRLPNGFGEAKVVGKVSRGTAFVVTSILEKRNLESRWYWCLAHLNYPEEKPLLVDVSPIADLRARPPIIFADVASRRQ